MIHGVQVGPFLIVKHPDVFWGVIASMYIGNAMLLMLNLPLIGMWVRLLKIPYWTLAPLILLFCLVGAFGVDGYIYDALIMVLVGILGYLMRKFEYEAAPFVLAFILGPMFEVSFRQSLLYSYGDPLVFIKRPISGAFIGLAVLVIVSNLVRKKRSTKVGESHPFGQFSSALVLLIIAILFLLQVSHYSIGTLRKPGTGLFPVFLGGILGFLGLVSLIREAIRKTAQKRQFKNPWVGLKWSKTICVLVSLILYIVSFEAVGFLLSTFLLMGFLFILMKPEKWLAGTLGAFLSSGISFVIFKTWLHIQLPLGIIERLLGLS